HLALDEQAPDARRLGGRAALHGRQAAAPPNHGEMLALGDGLSHELAVVHRGSGLEQRRWHAHARYVRLAVGLHEAHVPSAQARGLVDAVLAHELAPLGKLALLARLLEELSGRSFVLDQQPEQPETLGALEL